MYAGSPSVIASLWSVDDEATGQLMVAFYTHLKEGLGGGSSTPRPNGRSAEVPPIPITGRGFRFDRRSQAIIGNSNPNSSWAK